jgi:hypothetical protein
MAEDVSDAAEDARHAMASARMTSSIFDKTRNLIMIHQLTISTWSKPGAPYDVLVVEGSRDLHFK